MAWTEITRPKYQREGLRYASDTTDEEWSVMALVHLPEGGRSGASSEPLCDDPPETGRFRAPGRQHPIKDRQADGSLCLLRGETVCTQPRPDQRLVAAHRHFDE